MNKTDGARFETWAQGTKTEREHEFVDRMEEEGYDDRLAYGFIGGIESERARVREIADRIEKILMMEPDMFAKIDRTFALVKELRGNE